MIGEIMLFGAALDVLDDPGHMALKRGWAEALRDGRVSCNEPLDPFDALAPTLLDSCPKFFSSAGKLDFPTCFTPRPLPEDINAIEPMVLRFYDDISMSWTMMRRARRYIEQRIFPAIPGMISVDHSLTAGAYAACCNRYGPDNVSLLILDSHFDAIPTELRAPSDAGCAAFPSRDSLHCGNFIERMLENCSDYFSIIQGVNPRNIYVIGPSDFPPASSKGESESLKQYRLAYMAMMESGVTVIPKTAVRSGKFRKCFLNMLEKISTPYVYVSLDADVGSVACMNAVRFQDTVGLDEDTIMDVSRILGKAISSGQIKLAGFDISEIDVHLLGLSGPDGKADRTVEVCTRFLETLVGCDSC